MLEAAVAGSFLAITLAPIDTATRTGIFQTLGAACFADVTTLINIAVGCVVVGGGTIAVGAVLAYTSQSKAQQQQKQ